MNMKMKLSHICVVLLLNIFNIHEYNEYENELSHICVILLLNIFNIHECNEYENETITHLRSTTPKHF